jgi:branched-subunit amino acid aminotransferase/4-amino-4-deoxychorismate lyase
MKAAHAIRNGALIPAEQASVSVFHKAFFFDYAVYANVKVVRNKLFIPDYEVEKLFESASRLGLQHSFTKKEVVEWAKRLVDEDKLGDALLRLLLIGAAAPDEEPQLFIFPVGLTFYADKLYSRGAPLVTVSGERHLPGVKSKDLLMSFQAFGEAQRVGAIDALLVDSKGSAREGTRTTFYAIKGSELVTAPKELVLDGVTRKIVLELAPSCGLKVVEKEIPLADLLNKKFDELLVSNTTMGVMPVSKINETVYAVGAKTKELIKAFKDYCAQSEHWI